MEKEDPRCRVCMESTECCERCFLMVCGTIHCMPASDCYCGHRDSDDLESVL